MITGTVVSGLALGTVSVLTDVPGADAPRTEKVEVTPGSGFDLRREDREATLPGVAQSPKASDAPQVVPPKPDDLSSLNEADTRPARAPATGEADALADVPDPSADSDSMQVESVSPVLPSPQARAPLAPGEEGRLSISTDPAQPPAPDPGEADVGFEAPDLVPDTRNVVPDLSDGAALQPDVSQRARAPSDGGPVVAPDEGEVKATEQSKPDSEQTPSTLAPSGTIADRVDGMRSNRLPRIGESLEAEQTDPEAEMEPVQTSALTRNAEAFDNPEGKPLMSIILIDDGTSPIGVEALSSFPYPVSFAVDADWAGAADAAARYRAAGFEVLLIVDLPRKASAADVEVAMQSALSRVPQAVGVLEGNQTGLQASREASLQLAPILNESGHGLVMYPEGLDTARKLLAREGVPAATLFRDFDAQGQNAAAVRRFLDQAAMKAGQQDEGVIMLGRLRAETVSALLLWGLQDRANRVALAPVSAILRAGSE